MNKKQLTKRVCGTLAIVTLSVVAAEANPSQLASAESYVKIANLHAGAAGAYANVSSAAASGNMAQAGAAYQTAAKIADKAKQAQDAFFGAPLGQQKEAPAQEKKKESEPKKKKEQQPATLPEGALGDSSTIPNMRAWKGDRYDNSLLNKILQEYLGETLDAETQATPQ